MVKKGSRKDKKKLKASESPFEGANLGRNKGLFDRFFREHERKSVLPEATSAEKKKMEIRDKDYAGARLPTMREKATPLDIIQELITDLQSSERKRRIYSALSLVDIVVKERPKDPKTQEVIKELSLIVVRDKGLDVLIDRHRKKMLKAISQFHPNPDVRARAKEALENINKTTAAITKIKNLLAA